jgi:hypothetical protein
LNALSSRELALAIWGALLLAFLLSKRSIRGSLLGVAKAALASKIVTWFAIVLLYNALVVVALRAIGVWNLTLLKDTILWFVFAGIALAFRSAAISQGDRPLLGILKDTAKVFVVVEFLANTYTLRLAWEMILIPILALLAAVDAVAQTDPKYAQAGRIATCLLSAAGLAVFGFAITKAIADFGSLWSFESLRRLLLPPVLSILLLPMIYTVALYMTYDLLFSRLLVALDADGAVARYARRHIRAACGASLRRARAMLRERGHDLMLIRSREDVDMLFGEPEGR